MAIALLSSQTLGILRFDCATTIVVVAQVRYAMVTLLNVKRAGGARLHLPMKFHIMQVVLCVLL